MSKSHFKSVDGANIEGLDKVDMSLDDIIRLNKKQKQTQTQKAKRRALVKGRLNHGKMSGAGAEVPSKTGGAIKKCFSQNCKLQSSATRRHGQGVITGLAARKNASLLKVISPHNQANNSALNQRSQPFVQRCDTQHQQMQLQSRHRQMDSKGSVSPRPFRLHREWNIPSSQQTQRESRQATFLFRRGLKVKAQVQKTKLTLPTQRTRTWRIPSNNSGILTVSIDNPTARTQPEHVQSWFLNPLTSTHLSPPSKEESERKLPKGVALQFNINSVGKQTGMTLNERFRILKNQRVVSTAHQSSKEGRFVTVA